MITKALADSIRASTREDKVDQPAHPHSPASAVEITGLIVCCFEEPARINWTSPFALYM